MPPASSGKINRTPDWYPGWARELAELYFSGTTCLFVLHGNVHDLLYAPEGEGGASYGDLPEFLSTQMFGNYDLILHYDLARGLRVLGGKDPKRHQEMTRFLTGILGDLNSLPREADNVLLLLHKFIENVLVREDLARKRYCFLFDYAQYLAPAGDVNSLSRGSGTNLVRFLGWAQNPYIKQRNMAFCLIADRISEVNTRLVQSPHVAAISLPLPDTAERERFITWSAEGADKLPQITTYSARELAELSNGLNLHNLHVVLAQGKRSGRVVDAARFKELKKTLIERQCQGLLEFIEPKHTLDLVVGMQAAKERLRQDADLLSRGRTEAAPMGYLLCGSVGTGKSFLAECYAGSIGIPCVKLRNFRSKYVGETEGNLEQVLTVLRSLGPVVVLIDEADASLGTRQTDGDSGTSSRVFSMIATQMGDTKYRGRIVWMLMTSRPELLPIDLKRQGRCEVHIPLFYPQTEDEIHEMFTSMARKNKIKLAADALPMISPTRNLSGSDIESIVLAARRLSLAAGREEVTRTDVEEAVNQFVPSSQGLEKEMQELSAVLECTQLNFLPPEWRKIVSEPNGRVKLQERFQALRQILEK